MLRFCQAIRCLADSFLIVFFELVNCPNVFLIKVSLQRKAGHFIRNVFDSFFSVSTIRFLLRQFFDSWLIVGMMGCPA